MGLIRPALGTAMTPSGWPLRREDCLISLLEPESSGAADESNFTSEAPAYAQSLQPDQPG
jgi:hypothetical protein